MSNDPIVEYKVKKKLVRMLSAWHAQYKNDPSMRTAANLYKQHKNDAHSIWRPDVQVPKDEEFEAVKRKTKDEARRKAKEEAEKKGREEKEAAERLKRERAGKPKSKRKPFNFEEVLQLFSNATSRSVTESRSLGETKDSHADRWCNPIREQPRKCHHCKFFVSIPPPFDNPDGRR